MRNLFLITFLLVILTGCTSVKTSPTIIVNSDILTITAEEYEEISESELVRNGELLNITEISKLLIEVQIEEDKRFKQTRIEIPEIHSTIDHFDRFRSFKSGSHGSEPDINYATGYVIFDSKGLDKKTIQNIYGDKEIKVSWNEKEQEKSQIYVLGELLIK